MRSVMISALVLASLLAGCQRPGSEPRSASSSPTPGEAANVQETPLISQPNFAKVDEVLQGYSPLPEGLHDSLGVVGSDSMDPLVQLWAENFQSLYPKVTFTIVSKGSATAPKALIEGRSQLGPMSREMSPVERAQFEERFGYAPTRVVVAVDALAVYVNANNPIPFLTMPQVDAIFSATRKGGYPTPINTWGDLGLGEPWTARTIQPYGRDENSGTRAFFREHALKKGDYKPEVKALPDQFATVEAAAMDAAGICYGPIQHSVRMVKAVPLADFSGGKAIMPTVENILGGRYPLNRFLYIYVNKVPGKPLAPAVREFLKYALSREGQAAVSNFGAIPLPGDMVGMNLGKL